MKIDWWAVLAALVFVTSACALIIFVGGGGQFAKFWNVGLNTLWYAKFAILANFLMVGYTVAAAIFILNRRVIRQDALAWFACVVFILTVTYGIFLGSGLNDVDLTATGITEYSDFVSALATAMFMGVLFLYEVYVPSLKVKQT